MSMSDQAFGDTSTLTAIYSRSIIIDSMIYMEGAKAVLLNDNWT